MKRLIWEARLRVQDLLYWMYLNAPFALMPRVRPGHGHHLTPEQKQELCRKAKQDLAEAEARWQARKNRDPKEKRKVM